MGKAVLIIVFGSIILYGIVNLNVNSRIGKATQTAVDSYSETQVRNIANSVAEYLLAKVGDNSNYRVNSPQTIDMFGGTSTYTITNSFFEGDSLIKFAVNSAYNGVNKSITVYGKVAEFKEVKIPVTVKAAITTNNDVDTKGTIVIDGRDHDLNGNLIPNQGTKGVSTTNSYSRGGNSKVGATSSKVDYSPSKKINSNVVTENESWPGGFPGTPDLVLGGASNGFPEGTLMSIAKTGKNGSQYVTDPNKLNNPLKGVTYVDLPNKSTWQPMSLEGTGILVVHNKNTNAVMKNLNSGTFKGLLIADDIVHIHTDIIGAIFGLTTNPSEGNCIGNGNGNVLFSSEALKKGIGVISSGGQNFGFGKHRIDVKYWFE